MIPRKSSYFMLQKKRQISESMSNPALQLRTRHKSSEKARCSSFNKVVLLKHIGTDLDDVSNVREVSTVL